MPTIPRHGDDPSRIVLSGPTGLAFDGAMMRYIPALKYDWLTPFFDLFMRSMMPEEQFRSALVVQAGIKSDHRVLDFGTGTAALSLRAKQQVPQAQIRGTDVDDGIIRIARAKIEATKMEIGLDMYDGNKLPYPDCCFDRVISSLVFHHLTREQKSSSLSEIRRVLKPGGELHIADWGKAQNKMQRALFLSVQVLDGFETTADNVRGLLPALISAAGFVDVLETSTFTTMFGALSLYRAGK